MKNDIYSYLLKTGQPEMVTENEDGSYSVFIDPDLSENARIERFIHAVKHINRNDFRQGITADQAEREAHEIN